MADEEKRLSVAEISAKIKKEGLSWQAGETPLTTLPAAERKRHLGLIVTEEDMTRLAKATKRKVEEEVRVFEAAAPLGIPAAWDWRNVNGKNFVTPVKDQGSCGSCVSFGTLAAVEATMRIKANNPSLTVDLSEAFLQFCGGGSCSGWGLTSGLDYAKSTGVTDDACFPYQPQDLPCGDRCGDWESRRVKVLGYTVHASLQARKNAIATIGPVVGGMAVYSDFFAYKSGIYEKTAAATLSGYHCICVVGYDDNDQCWIIKNSWGADWGADGFCRIRYGQADLLIDSSWSFYACDPEVKPQKGCGSAQYVVVDKHFGGNVVLFAYAGDAWRHKVITDADLAGFVQEAFAAKQITVCWDGDVITMIRTWQSPA